MSQIDCGPFNLCGPLQLQVLQGPKPGTAIMLLLLLLLFMISMMMTLMMMHECS